MTIPGDVVTSVWDSLIVTIHALQDLPIPNRRILDQALTSLDDVLLKCTYESWTVEEANSALQKLGDALLKTSRYCTLFQFTVRVLEFSCSFEVFGSDTTFSKPSDFNSIFCRILGILLVRVYFTRIDHTLERVSRIGDIVNSLSRKF